MGGKIQFLLDTHVLLWWLIKSRNISASIADALGHGANRVFVSPVSAIEVAIKHRLGKLPLGDVLVPRFRPIVEERGFATLTITVEDMLRAGSYPAVHRDPFDRLLAAQAELNGLTLITRDREFAQFPCRILW